MPSIIRKTLQVLIAGLLGATCGEASSQQLWFGPGDDLNVQGVVSHPEYMKLFASGRQWPVGLAHIDVFMARAPWFLRMPEDTVRQLTGFLRQRHIALAVPLGFVTSETCGPLEGVGSERQMLVYPREMKKRGIEIDYVTMDEPLFYGHDYAGKNACNLSIESVAASVAKNVRMIRSFYPKVKFVLTEPEQGLAGGAKELSEFLNAYEAELNELPEAVRFDVSWGQADRWHLDWHPVIPPFIRMLKARGIGYSIIYDAGRVSGRVPTTDAGCIASAKANIADWQATIREKPKQVVIQSWSPNPIVPHRLV